MYNLISIIKDVKNTLEAMNVGFESNMTSDNNHLNFNIIKK